MTGKQWKLSPRPTFIALRQEHHFRTGEMTVFSENFPALSTSFMVKQMKWSSSCVSINFKNSSFSFLVQDGQVHEFKSRSSEPRNHYIRGRGIAIIGQEQDDFGKLLDRQQSLKGFVADFRWYFNNSHDKGLLKQWTSQPNVTIPGTPLMSFDNFDDFTNSEVTILNMDTEDEFFPSHSQFKKFFSKALEFKNAENFCYAVGGDMMLPKNEEENNELVDDLSESPAMCHVYFRFQSAFWLGAFIESHSVIHHATKKPALFSSFKTTPRHNNHKCISFNGCKNRHSRMPGIWSQNDCKYPRKMICSFNTEPVFKIRGLKHGSAFDTEYTFDDNLTNPKFIGKFNSIIEEVKESNKTKFWKLYYLNDPKVQAVTFPSPAYNYPIGYQTWNITNDDTFEGSLQLCFSSCSSTEFTCYDGSCIDRTKRCDTEKHCLDGSDENNCDLIKFPEAGYNPSIAPSISKDEKSFVIDIHVKIRRVVTLDINSFKLVTDVYSAFRWNDSGVKFLNLNEKSKLNQIPLKSDLLPWVPKQELRGYNNSMTDVSIFKTHLKILKQSEPEPDDTQDLYSDEVYKGSDNPLVIIYIVKVSSACDVELHLFPFDQQNCKLYVILHSDNNKLFLRPFKEYDTIAEYSGDRMLLQYEVNENIKVQFPNQKERPRIRMEIILTNRFVYYLLNTYVPSFILVVVGYLPFYFEVQNFSDRVMVALTALLVETTLFTQVGDYAPRTSYFKLIDIWCLFCIVTLFAIILSIVLSHKFLIGDWATESTERNSANQQVLEEPHFAPLPRKKRIGQVPLKLSSGRQSELPTFLPDKNIPMSAEEEKAKWNKRCMKANKFFQVAFPVWVLVFITGYMGVVAHSLRLRQ